jgi:hypothetical protein
MIRAWLIVAATTERSTTLARGPRAGATIAAFGGLRAEEGLMANPITPRERLVFDLHRTAAKRETASIVVDLLKAAVDNAKAARVLVEALIDRESLDTPVPNPRVSQLEKAYEHAARMELLERIHRLQDPPYGWSDLEEALALAVDELLVPLDDQHSELMDRVLNAEES